MWCSELPEPRRINDVTILGPDFFTVDSEGKSLSPIASVFPKYATIVTGRGIHAMQAAMMVEFLRKHFSETGRGDLSGEEEAEVYQNAVSLLVRDSIVLIRSEPGDMDRIFAADEILQRLLPKERIQFTGIHLPEVRKTVRFHGESWRISPPPRSIREIDDYIRSNQVHVHTNTLFYHNPPRGGRFLTYREFMRIRPLIRENREEALERLREIVHLTRLTNNQGARELSFFLPIGKDLSTDLLERLICLLERTCSCEPFNEAENLFDLFAASYAEVAGPELTTDGEDCTVWRTTMFCRLYDINENMVEEWTLGLSPEFRLNVRWLPGARIIDHQLLFEPNAEHRIRSLITHFWQTWTNLVSVNVGRVEAAQTDRDRAGEQREVYLVVLGLADGTENIRLVRMMKWDVMHRIKIGIPLNQAVAMTFEYRDYIFDRLKAATALDVCIPSFTEIRLEEEPHGLGVIPVFFFDRRYVSGMATDKIPSAQYGRQGFIVRLARLLGVAAATSLVLGRASPRTGQIYFDDGDEVIQFDAEGFPVKLIITETTGSFTNWSTPISTILPCCLEHLAGHLIKAQEKGISHEELTAATEAFADGLITEIDRMQCLLKTPSSRLRALFEDRSQEPGGIRCRWEGVLNRLEMTDTAELRRMIAESPYLRPFKEKL